CGPRKITTSRRPSGAEIRFTSSHPGSAKARLREWRNLAQSSDVRNRRKTDSIPASITLRALQIRARAKIYPTPPRPSDNAPITPLEGSRPLIHRCESEVIEREAPMHTRRRAEARGKPKSAGGHTGDHAISA